MMKKTSFAVALGITGFVGWALFAEEPMPGSGTGDSRRICEPGFAKSIRPPESVTERIKLRMLRERGIPPWFAYLWRLDHIVPLCLDGNPLLAENLQLQRVDDSIEKDHREIEACRAYCAGEMTLEEARGLFHRSETQ